MDIITCFFIGIGLAMDVFAVSIANGTVIKKLRLRNVLTIAMFFGVFQGLMPVAGWFFGNGVKGLIATHNHWIAFGLLGLVGVKMIYESFSMDRGDEEEVALNVSRLLVLSIATNIDALAVGMSFSFVEVRIIVPVLILGTVAFVFSVAGLWIGKKMGHFFERKIEVMGGLILIGIGCKILIENWV